MPVQTIDTSGNAKTGKIAVTYRSGHGQMFGTCPVSCALNPNTEESAKKPNHEYLNALLAAVPTGGKAFTYSHFPFGTWARAFRSRLASGKPTTTVNYSADSRAQAKRAVKAGIPCVLAAPAADVEKYETRDGVRYVQCPATYLDRVTCETCGGGSPLCARPERDYVIVFPAHGATAKRVGTKDPGGCYASGGNVRIHWDRLSKRVQPESDAEKLTAWVKTLPEGKILRHHVAGDIG